MSEISEDAIKLGKAIYLKALSGRRGFRSDQLGIPEDDDVWLDIYEAVGVNALEAAAPFIIAAERERIEAAIRSLHDRSHEGAWNISAVLDAVRGAA